ncbi:MAG: ABC transporter substrate-binding protein [Actinomycetota bacterium]|nr:ABC transporter substrate-binding protein [Actinomycetota bacterium]
MHRRIRGFAIAGVMAAFALGLPACGGNGDDDDNGGARGAAATEPVSGQKRGGTLRVQSAEGFEHLDPGSSYFQLDYVAVYAVHRPLYSFRPEDPETPEPDLASAPPRISADDRTVTVTIRPGVRFSPPVNREVTSRDVKFAIERGFSPNVANGYAPSYFGAIRGADKAKGGPIAGIRTPDDRTIVFELTQPFGATMAKALTLPLSAPVPKEYVEREDLDAKSPTVYDSAPARQAFTGPYVIAKYTAGKSLSLARNPNWDPETDFRPAYLDRIEWTVGADPNVAGRQILTGKGQVNGDTPPAPIVKLAATKHKDQISFTPLGNRYISMNTQIPPFDDVNVRKAVVAATDRVALQLTRGGPIAGEIATHFLAPGAPGFEAAGGAEGPDVDFLDNPRGDMELAAEYLRRAGHRDGRYSGPPITMIADNADPAAKSAQVTLQTFQRLGFEVKYRAVSHETMYSKFCNVPAAKVHVCPNVGWLPDFPDGYAWLYVPFNGKSITPQNNANWPQLDDPKVNAAMDRAQAIADEEKRAEAWGEVDRLVTELAAAVPWFWDNTPNIQSEDVQGVIARWNAAYDISWTSLK